MDTINTFRDTVLRKEMREIEAKIIIVLTKKGGEFVIPQHQHYAAGIAGVIGKKPQNLVPILAGMVSLGWLTEFKEEHGRRTFYKVSSQDAVNQAAELLGIQPEVKITECKKCGASYSSVLKCCPQCARKEADVILETAKKPSEQETSLSTISTDLDLPPETESPQTAISEKVIRGQRATVKHLRNQPTASDMNAISHNARKKDMKASKKFSDFCKAERLTPKEIFALQVMVSEEGTLINEAYWDFRADVIVSEKKPEMAKFFDSREKTDFLKAQILDIARDIGERYAAYLETIE